MKLNKNYVLGFVIDYGPPTILSVLWALYIVFQKPDDPFWAVFTKNFVPAFFVLNFIGMRVDRTKKSVDNKERFKKLFKQVDELQKNIESIEKKVDEINKNTKN